jgi:hypothetical protein
MEDWQLRVLAEQDELFSKIEKLKEFIEGETYASLTLQAKDVLIIQLSAMATYSAVLNLRMAEFMEEENATGN